MPKNLKEKWIEGNDTMEENMSFFQEINVQTHMPRIMTLFATVLHLKIRYLIEPDNLKMDEAS